MKTADLIKLFKDFYKNEPFIRIKPEGVFPNTKDVKTTNFCDIACFFDERTERILILSVIDNLTKGAAGQAIQNFNLMAGLEETLALKLLAHVP